MIKKRLQNIMGRRLVTGTVENLRPNEILIKEDNGRAGLFTFINGGVVDITKALESDDTEVTYPKYQYCKRSFGFDNIVIDKETLEASIVLEPIKGSGDYVIKIAFDTPSMTNLKAITAKLQEVTEKFEETTGEHYVGALSYVTSIPVTINGVIVSNWSFSLFKSRFNYCLFSHVKIVGTNVTFTNLIQTPIFYLSNFSNHLYTYQKGSDGIRKIFKYKKDETYTLELKIRNKIYGVIYMEGSTWPLNEANKNKIEDESMGASMNLIQSQYLVDRFSGASKAKFSTVLLEGITAYG